VDAAQNAKAGDTRSGQCGIGIQETSGRVLASAAKCVQNDSAMPARADDDGVHIGLSDIGWRGLEGRARRADQTVHGPHGEPYARAAGIAWTNALELAVMVAQSFFATASLDTSDVPTPTNKAPALIHSGAFLRSTPPVGVKRSLGRGASRSLK